MPRNKNPFVSNKLNMQKFCLHQKFLKVQNAMKVPVSNTGVINTSKLKKIGTNSILYCQKSSCPVVSYEDMFETILRCHDRVDHSGRDKTWNEIKTNYSWIRHDIVGIFLKTCAACTQRKPVKHVPTGKPMIALGFLLRVQVDLIDFRSRPDGEYKWIMHVRDHFSKFSWAYPLKSKCASEVCILCIYIYIYIYICVCVCVFYNK